MQILVADEVCIPESLHLKMALLQTMTHAYMQEGLVKVQNESYILNISLSGRLEFLCYPDYRMD